MSKQLVELDQLATMQHDAAMSQLAQLNRAIEKLENKISDLRARLNTTQEEDPEMAFLSFTSGHYDRWQRWVEREIASYNIQLAQARSKREGFIAKARHAFGRKSATQALLDKHYDTVRITTRKRFEQEANNA